MNPETQSFDVIHQRMLAGMDSGLDKRQGSVAYDLTAPCAAEHELAYASMAVLLDRGFADTAEGEDLDRCVANAGITRKPGQYATGKLDIQGTDGFTVEAGTVAMTASGIRFLTQADGVIVDGAATVPIMAESTGAAGNVDACDITLIDGNLAGITGVINPEPTSGGVDQEDDDALFIRFQEKVSLPATSGNTYHYRLWAMAVPGVADVEVFPVWNGPTTVKIVLACSEGTTPEAVAEDVVQYIEDMRPIGADVTVVPAQAIPIAIQMQVTVDPTYIVAEVTDEIHTKLEQYIASLGLRSSAVLYSQVMKAIITTDGVLDCKALTLNGAAGDVELPNDAAPVLTEVVFA